MTTEPTSSTDGGQASTSGTGQAPTSTTDGQAPVSQKQTDHERIIEELRKENASHRAKLKSFEEAEVARQQASLSDLEKEKSRADKAEKEIKQYQEQLVHAEIKYAAQNKGIINPDLIADNIFKSLEFEDGKPTNLDKQLDELIKANPYLIKQSPDQQAAQTGLQKRPPMTPPNSPGRSQIVQPGSTQLQPGQKVRLDQIDWRKRE